RISGMEKLPEMWQKRFRMKRNGWACFLVIAGLAISSLLGPFAIERVHAATVPDVRGTWTASSSGTLSHCHNPENNGDTGAVPVTVEISGQSGATFSGSGSFQISVSEGLFEISFSFSGILASSGDFTASGTFESRRVSDQA